MLHKNGIKRMLPRGGTNASKGSKDKEPSDSLSSSENESMSSSSDNENKKVQGKTRVIAKERRPRKKKDTNTVEIKWLSDLLNDLEGEAGVTAPVAPDSVMEHAKELVVEAFGPIDNPNTEDVLERDEESYVEQVTMESGLTEMTEREEKVISKACEEFSKSSERKAKESMILESNIADSIANMVQSGLVANPEEAAEEVMLNQLIGNGFDKSTTMSESMSTSDGAGAGVALDTNFSARNTSLESLDTALTHWLSECVLSMNYLWFLGM